MARTYRDSRRVKARIACRVWMNSSWALFARPFPKDADFGHFSSTGGGYPHWWDRLHHTRPARAATRARLQQVLRGWSDDGNWPDYRKPHIYYW